jgi:hypothetical protein
MIAALFVCSNGVYYNLPNVDPWDWWRDAKEYKGPHPVVAHPPCTRWSRMASFLQWKQGIRIGDDDGCFKSALISVRTFGGILEHPAYSYAWKHFGLLKPEYGKWTGDQHNGFVTEIDQVAYSHRANKKTWLYCFGYIGTPRALNWSYNDIAECTVTALGRTKNGKIYDPYRGKKSLTQGEANKTPPAFRNVLIDIAENVSINYRRDRNG